MADNTTLNTGTGGDVIATDDISGVKFQRVKITIGADGVNGGDVSSTNRLPVDLPGDASFDVNVTNASIPISDNGGSITVDGTVDINQPSGASFRVRISDGTSDVPIDAAHEDGETNTENHIDVGAKGLFFNGVSWDRVRGNTTDGMLVNLGANNDVTVSGTVTANAGTGTMNVSVQNASIPVTDNGGSLTVDGSVSVSNFPATQPVSGTVTIQDGGNTITVDGTVTVTDGLNIEGTVANDSVDSGNPVKIGYQAVSALPTAVATGDRVNAIADLYGRQLVTNIDDGMQVWKAGNYTTTQNGTDIWTPSAGKRIGITYMAISSYATTAGRVIIWLGASGDTTYNAGTDQLVWAGSFAPSANAKPGAIISLPYGIYAVTADHRLKITTDAAISLDLTVYGYEH